MIASRREGERAAQMTVEALMFVFREEGIEGLKLPKNQARLRECSFDQVADMVERLVECREKYPGRDKGISDGLLQLLRTVATGE